MRYYPPAGYYSSRLSPDDKALEGFEKNRRHVLDDARGVNELRKATSKKVADLCRLMRESMREARLYAKDMRDTDNRDLATKQLLELRKLASATCPRGK